MLRFAILRDLAQGTTRADWDAGAIQTLVAMKLVNVGLPDDISDTGLIGVEWVRSYWKPESRWGMCLYTGPDARTIEDYQRKCGAEYAEISEIIELSASRHADSEAVETPSGAKVMLAVEATIPERLNVEESLFENISAFLARAAAVLIEGSASDISWVRSYWDEKHRRVLAVYAAPSDETVDALAYATANSGIVVRQIIEIYPDEYLDTVLAPMQGD